MLLVHQKGTVSGAAASRKTRAAAAAVGSHLLVKGSFLLVLFIFFISVLLSLRGPIGGTGAEGEDASAEVVATAALLQPF